MELTVAQLEKILFEAFPRENAERWDAPGMAVGDPEAPVTRIALNLDMTADAVIAAAEAGCDALVTHHPPFIKEGPHMFAPQETGVAAGPGRLVYEAISRDVAAIAMHTNADRAVELRSAYADALGLECTGNFEQLMDPGCDPQGCGFGALLNANGITLAELAERCLFALGGAPRVWGDPDETLGTVALLNGSWSDQEVYDICVAGDIDCVIVGEARYHFCVDAQPHLNIIELGHDISELPVVSVLRNALIKAGIDKDDIVELELSEYNWWTPQGGM